LPLAQLDLVCKHHKAVGHTPPPLFRQSPLGRLLTLLLLVHLQAELLILSCLKVILQAT
jgi:hypothetical protein